MCNEYQQLIDWENFQRTMYSVGLKIDKDTGQGDLFQSGLEPKKPDVPFDPIRGFRISELCPVIRAIGDEVGLTPMEFGLLKPGRPAYDRIYNFVSEGRDFHESTRVIVPASGFFEFTGEKSPKTKHLFTLNNEPMLGIVGHCKKGDDGIWRFTMITTSPGDDIAPFHDRQIVIAHPDQFGDWIFKADHSLLAPLPAGSLSQEIVRKGKDFGKNDSGSALLI